MPTVLELAQSREARKLKQAGLNPDGTPISASSGDEGEGEGEGEEEEEEQHEGNDAEDLREQIKTLQRELLAANGRVAPSQSQSDEYRRMFQQSETDRARERRELQEQVDSLRTQLETTNNAFDVESALTQEERDAIDPTLLQTVVKLADKIAQHRAPKVDVRSETLRVMEEREAKRVKDYRNQVFNDPARGLHQLGTLSTDPEFRTWLQEDENDMDSVVNSLLAAQSTEEVDRYARIVAKRIVKFKERTKKPTDGKPSLGGHMRREPKPKLSAEEQQAKFNEAKQLSRSRNPADRQKAQQILNSM